jgi:hypothetical protein
MKNKKGKKKKVEKEENHERPILFLHIMLSIPQQKKTRETFHVSHENGISILSFQYPAFII